MNAEFMNEALKQAKLSGKDIPVGCVIVKNGKIIASACNEREKTKKITAHAEIIAIEKAAKVLNNLKLDECEMYVTLEPCPMCAGAIIQSRIKSICFGAYDNLYGAFGSKIDMRKVMNSKIPGILGGIMENECKEVLKQFFNEMRKND